MPVREYSGAAKRTALVGDITAGSTTLTVADGTGYPTGATGPFAIAFRLGAAAEEKVLIASRSGNTLTVASGGRGFDGTTAAAHQSGSTVDHVLTATDIREANAHVNDATGDPHPQYLTPTGASAAYAPIGHRGARVFASGAAQTIANAVDVGVQFNAESFDPQGWHDNATNNTRLTCPAGQGGKYLVVAGVAINGNTTGRRFATIYKNGAAVALGNVLTPSVLDGVVCTVADLVEVVPGDFIEVAIFQNSGGALALIAGSSLTYCSITKVGT